MRRKLNKITMVFFLVFMITLSALPLSALAEELSDISGFTQQITYSSEEIEEREDALVEEGVNEEKASNLADESPLLTGDVNYDPIPEDAPRPADSDEPNEYTSDITGEKVIDGVGEESGVRYQPAGYVWIKEEEPTEIDGVDYFTYDIPGEEDEKLGIRLLIDCDPTSPNLVDEGEEISDELYAIATDNAEKIANVALNNGKITEETADILVEEAPAIIVNNILDPLNEDNNEVYAATTAEVGLTAFTSGSGDSYRESAISTGATTYRKFATINGTQIPLYCIAPNRTTPSSVSQLGTCTLYTDWTNNTEHRVMARIMALGFNGPRQTSTTVETVHQSRNNGKFSYLDTDAAVYESARRIGWAAAAGASSEAHPSHSESHWDQKMNDHFWRSDGDSLLLYQNAQREDASANGGNYGYQIIRVGSGGTDAWGWNFQQLVGLYRVYPPTTVTITKQSANNSATKLSGAKFQYSVPSGGGVAAAISNKATNATGSNGQVSFTVSGRYHGKEITVKETTAPTNYSLNSTPKTAMVAEPSGHKDATTKTKSLTFTNTPSAVTLTITKLDNVTGSALSGAIFTIKNGSTTVGTTSRTGTNGKGKVKFSIPGNLVGKSLTVTETTAPPDYTLQTASQTLVPTVGGSPTLTFRNNPTSAKIVITKKDSTTGKALSGAKFTFTCTSSAHSANVGLGTTSGTGTDGKVTFTVPVAHTGHKIKWTESTVPTNYTKGSDDSVTTTAGTTYNETVTNAPKPATLTITKKDSTTGAVMSGVRFELSYNGTAFATATTNTSGVATFTIPSNRVGLTLTLTETIPSNYTGSATRSFTASPGGSHTLSITNTPKPATVQVHKVDDLSGLGIQGAAFKFNSSDGTTVVTSGTTNANGYATVTIPSAYVGLPLTIVESTTPTQYVTMANDTITCSPGGSHTKTLKNRPQRGTIEVVKTAEDFRNFTVQKNGDSEGIVQYPSIPLAGAEFAVYAKTDIIQPATGQVRAMAGDKVATLTTGADGHGRPARYYYRAEGYTSAAGADLTRTSNSFEYAFIGQYEVRETDAPVGYEIAAPKTVNVTGGGITVEYNTPNQVSVFNYASTAPKTTFVKYDEFTGEPLANAYIDFFRKSDGKLIYQGKTDSRGLVNISSLPLDEYYFVERTAPEGYVRDPSMQTFEVVRHGEPIEVEFSNRPRGSDITIEGVGEDPNNKTFTNINEDDTITTYDMKEVPGKSFNLVAAENIYTFPGSSVLLAARGDVVSSGTTDSNGELHLTEYHWRGGITTDYAFIASYMVVETAAPSEYRLNTVPKTLNVKDYDDGSDLFEVRVEFANYLKKGHYKIKKVSAMDTNPNAPVPGAIIGLYDEEGNLLYQKTIPESGNMNIYELPLGTYTFREIETPEGFYLNPHEYMSHLELDGQTIEGMIENYHINFLLPSAGLVDNRNIYILSGIGIAVIASIALVIVYVVKKKRK